MSGCFFLKHGVVTEYIQMYALSNNVPLDENNQVFFNAICNVQLRHVSRIEINIPLNTLHRYTSYQSCGWRKEWVTPTRKQRGVILECRPIFMGQLGSSQFFNTCRLQSILNNVSVNCIICTSCRILAFFLEKCTNYYQAGRRQELMMGVFLLFFPPPPLLPTFPWHHYDTTPSLLFSRSLCLFYLFPSLPSRLFPYP